VQAAVGEAEYLATQRGAGIYRNLDRRERVELKFFLGK